jgi:hypothetical protein
VSTNSHVPGVQPNSYSLEQPDVISQGIRRNRRQSFAVDMAGADWYSLLQFIESSAERSTAFESIRTCVHLSDLIRAQLREQGF